MQKITEAFLIQDDRERISLPAMVIFVHTITALKTHFEIAAKDRGVVFQPDNVLYVLTVPAIWSESAKEFMKRAAIKVFYLHLGFMYFNNTINLFDALSVRMVEKTSKFFHKQTEKHSI